MCKKLYNISQEKIAKQNFRKKICLQNFFFKFNRRERNAYITKISKNAKFLQRRLNWPLSWWRYDIRLTHGRALLAVSSGSLGVEHPHRFLEAAVQLRPVRREAERVRRRQLVQVVVGPESGAHVAVEGVPHVDRVVPAAAGQTVRQERKGEELKHLQTDQKI